MMNIIPVDERSIREQYLAGDIFKIGSIIESNGKLGNIFRRGANHLICIDSDKNVFRTWISEAKEIRLRPYLHIGISIFRSQCNFHGLYQSHTMLT